MKKIFMVFSIILLISCSPSKTLVDTSCPGYKSINFNRTQISENGIGILPVLGGSGKEQFRRPMGDAITKNFKAVYGNNKVKSTNQVISLLNENGISEEYTNALNNYNISGIIPKEMVMKLGKVLGVKYLLYTRLLSDYKVNGLNKLDLSELYVKCQVWDCNLGDVVWEGKGGSAKLEGNRQNLVEKTASGLSNVVGLDKTEWTCRDKKVLIKSIDEAYTNMILLTTILSVVGGALLYLAIIP